MSQLSLKALFGAGAHYGHRVRFWHPSNSRFVYGRHAGIHIINLDRTIEAFNRSLDYLTEQAASNKKILFVCTKRIAQPWLAEAAKRCGMPYVDNRWLGGTLTNFYTVRQSIERLDRVEKMLEDDKLGTVYVKKEILKMRKNYQKLLRSFGGIRNMTNLPDVLFVIDVGYERIAVAEARKLGIPVVGIVDTNHSSEDIDYPIPGNDDSMSAIKIYLDTVADALAQVLPEGAIDNIDSDQTAEAEPVRAPEESRVPAQTPDQPDSDKTAGSQNDIPSTLTAPQEAEAKSASAAAETPADAAGSDDERTE